MTQRQDYILRNKQIVLAKAQDGYGSVLFHKPAQITKTTALSTQKYLAQRHFIKLTAIFTRVGSKISVESLHQSQARGVSQSVHVHASVFYFYVLGPVVITSSWVMASSFRLLTKDMMIRFRCIN